MKKILFLASLGSSVVLAQSAGVGNNLFLYPVSSSSGVTINASVHQKGANPAAFIVANSAPSATIACNVAGSTVCNYTIDAAGDLTFTFSPAFGPGVIEIGSGSGTTANSSVANEAACYAAAGVEVSPCSNVSVDTLGNVVALSVSTNGSNSGALSQTAKTSGAVVTIAIPDALASGGTLQPPALGGNTYPFAVGGGDLSTTAPNTVTGINGAAPPASAPLVGTNNLGQLVAVAGPKVLYSTGGSSDQLSAATGTTQQTFATSYTLPANLIVAGRVIQIFYAVGLTTSSSPASARYQLYLGGTGGTLIFDSGVVTPAASLSARSGPFLCTITGTAAVGASAPVVASCGSSAVPGSPWSYFNTVTPIPNAATNGTLAITATMTYGATTAGNTANIYGMTVEQLN
jgi:hypothetical protein